MTAFPRPGPLALPDASRALRISGRPKRSSGSRAARRVLATSSGLAFMALLFAATVPLTRTVTLTGHLAAQRLVVVRAAEPGLIDEILVSAGDTVGPGQLVARLRSPELTEALRAHAPSTSTGPLLSRFARLDLHAPPWSTSRADGSADPASIFPGGVVLTEHLSRRRGARLDAGDGLLQIAVLDASRRAPLRVVAYADGRAALRLRPGLEARVIVTAVPATHPRQLRGRVARVSLSPTHPGKWRVEIDDVSTIAVQTDKQSESPTYLRPGLSTQVAVVERRETAARTVARWIDVRSADLSSRFASNQAVPRGSLDWSPLNTTIAP